MELCKKRKTCVAKSICAMNIKLDEYNCKQFHKAVESKFSTHNTTKAKIADSIKYILDNWRNLGDSQRKGFLTEVHRQLQAIC